MPTSELATAMQRLSAETGQVHEPMSLPMSHDLVATLQPKNTNANQSAVM